MGGLHLGGPELAVRIQPTVDFLSRQLDPPPAYILPMHCTGFRAKVALAAAFGEGCVPAGVGMKIEIHEDRGGDASMATDSPVGLNTDGCHVDDSLLS